MNWQTYRNDHLKQLKQLRRQYKEPDEALIRFLFLHLDAVQNEFKENLLFELASNLMLNECEDCQGTAKLDEPKGPCPTCNATGFSMTNDQEYFAGDILKLIKQYKGDK